jgi:type II secretory ATPase GspE/PulE/Tfp pilus assembly ATPase PilB-like protein
MFKVDKEMQNLISKNPIDSEIYKIARKNGMLSMKEDAMLKAVEGITPFREIYNFVNEGLD